jgi:hypothetical protein
VPDDRIKLIAGSSVWKTALSSKDRGSADNDFAAYLASSDSESSSSSSDSDNDSDTNGTTTDTAAAAAAAAATEQAVASTVKANKHKKASQTKEQKAAHARKVLLAEIGMLNSSDDDDNADNDNEVFHKRSVYEYVHTVQ